MSGSAVAIPWAQNHAEAILEAWYPGQAGGTAIAETISGANNPAGRLPVTFYSGVDQLPPFGDYSMKNRTYRYFTGKPAYGFGFGLSYSTFAYSNLTLSGVMPTPSGDIKASVTVTNTSKVPGDEVVELYLVPPALPTHPLRKLVGFTRIHLNAGENTTVNLNISADSIKTITDDGSPAVLSGHYRVIAAGAQPQDAASFSEATFNVP